MVKKKKDFGEHDKKTAARERKAASAREQKERLSKEEEDEYWTKAGEGILTKAQAKRKEQEKQRLEAQTRKLELKELSKAEEEQLGKGKKPKGRPSTAKVTQHELLLQREQTAADMEAEMKNRLKSEKKEVNEAAYAKIVDVENLNRDEGDVEARNVTDAIEALSKLNPGGEADIPEDLHPEKYLIRTIFLASIHLRRRKAAFKVFYERELVELREEKPGLKLSQYKDMIFKKWLKSPENPMNADM